MAKKIDVTGHVNRYLETDPEDIKELIAGLTDLLGTQKQRKRDKLRAELAAMEAEENTASDSESDSSEGVSYEPQADFSSQNTQAPSRRKR